MKNKEKLNEKEKEENIKELKKQTWKYFWFFKLWEILGIIGIFVFVWLSYIFQDELAKFLSSDTLKMILAYIVLTAIIGFILFIWIAINWSCAKEKAKKKLGLNWWEY